VVIIDFGDVSIGFQTALGMPTPAIPKTWIIFPILGQRRPRITPEPGSAAKTTGTHLSSRAPSGRLWQGLDAASMSL
jgi:hypothetical protein